VGASATGKGGVSIPLLAKAEAEGALSGELKRENAVESTAERRGLSQVVHEIGNSEFVILLDDFHYMLRTVQEEVAKSLKEAVRLGVKIVTASVSHRGDDVVRANPELRGRVKSIDLQYWNHAELEQLVLAGFDTLNIQVDSAAIQRLITESAGSPQLMQLLCLQSASS
jgi:hypothetical protein